MTHMELYQSPTGTMRIYTEYCPHNKGRPGYEWAAVHEEKIYKGVRPHVFYAATEAEALEKAEQYNEKRKEKHRQWRESAKRRREISKSSSTP